MDAAVPNPVTAVTSTVKSRKGLVAVVVIVLLVLAWEARTGAVTRLLAKLPVVGRFFVRKAG